MEHIKTLNTKNLQNTVKKGGCDRIDAGRRAACSAKRERTID